MRIQPRQTLLDIWQAVAQASFQDGKWVWGGREEPNSISDAEQLLCLMMPAAEVPSFRLDRPNQMDPDVRRALRVLGDEATIAPLLVRVLTDYHERYMDGKGVPVFPGGAFFHPADAGDEVTALQREQEVVESFSASVALDLATIGFARTLRGEVTRPDLIGEVDRLEELASTRLTAAMVGLLRSFTVYAFSAESSDGVNLLWQLSPSGLDRTKLVAQLREDLRPIRAGLLDLSIGSGRSRELGNSAYLFQCGWSWGIVKGAPPVDFVSAPGGQSPGVAFDAPYLYFTVVALDAIADLFNRRTKLLNLLNEEQQRLARALEIRWDLTQAFWSTLAGFGGQRWPLEDIPWRTSDGFESDYFSLLVTSISVRDLVARRASDADLGRLGQILTELANRGRVTRRPTREDPAIHMHKPGVTIPLEGPEDLGGPLLKWIAADFSALLLKRTVRIAELLNDIDLRSEIVGLADLIWQHVASRRLREGPGIELWDEPFGAYGEFTGSGPASWHHTVRVVESLVIASNLVSSHPLRSERLVDLAHDLLGEADHLFDQERFAGATSGGPALQQKLEILRSTLDRSRSILLDRPGTAVVLASEVLRELDRLAMARLAAAEIG
jgi:hypothetical protein